MRGFRRSVSDRRLVALKQEQLFRECLLPDIVAGKVFPAVRSNEIHFYHAGGMAFRYTAHGNVGHEFRSHCKYVSAPFSLENPYLSEKKFADRGHAVFFTDEYANIKQCCAKRFEGKERQQASAIQSQFSLLMSTETSSTVQVMPLDVEATFPKMKGRRGADGIDLALLDLRSGRLRFCEVKLHNDRRFVRYTNGRLDAADQLDRYDEQIEANKDVIAPQYSNHLAILRSLLPMSLPPHPELELDPERPLFLLVLGEPEDEKLRRKLESPDLHPYPRPIRSDAADRPCDNTLSQPSAMLDSPGKENALETHYGVQPDVPPGA